MLNLQDVQEAYRAQPSLVPVTNSWGKRVYNTACPLAAVCLHRGTDIRPLGYPQRKRTICDVCEITENFLEEFLLGLERDSWNLSGSKARQLGNDVAQWIDRRLNNESDNGGD